MIRQHLSGAKSSTDPFGRTAVSVAGDPVCPAVANTSSWSRPAASHEQDWPYTPVYLTSLSARLGLELNAAEPMQRFTGSSTVCLYRVSLDSTRQRKLNPL